MASSDMRIDLDFVEHPKTRRLIRMVGYEGFYCLMKLFAVTAKVFPKGELTGCDEHDIEDLADWRGKRGKFFSALSEPNFAFIEQAGGNWRIHDWHVHQPWIYNSKERSEIARQNAKKRDYSKKDGDGSMLAACQQHADGMPTAHELQCETDADGNAESVPRPCRTRAQNAPSPSPTPIYIPPLDTEVSIPPEGENELPKEGLKPKHAKKQAVAAENVYEVLKSEGIVNETYLKMLAAFVRHRQDIKKPMTPLALEQMVSLLSKELETDEQRIECLRLSIANGWQGVFPDKVKGQRSNEYRGKPSVVDRQSNSRFDDDDGDPFG